MKRLSLLTLMLTVFGISTLLAARNTAILKLKMASNEEFTASINGEFSGHARKVVTFDNLAPGEHFIEVYKEVCRPRPRGNGFHCQERLIYSGTIFLDRNTMTKARISHNGNLQVQNVVAINQHHHVPTGHQVVCGNGCINTCSCGSVTTYSPAPTGCGTTSVVYYGNTTSAPVSCALPAISHYEFQNLRNMLRNQSFESTRITVSKQALEGRGFTATQVRELLGCFSFESSKLEVAKFAYASTIDPHNFYLVNDAFYFSSSIHELNYFIQHS